ncbi:MAG: ABC transporter substrate-binding protein [Clostridiales bacterium]|jgi:simple sugar transport system substrate-binding protein|nr:ABC transporter substrate-binding protein [Clostridiales bacterium]
MNMMNAINAIAIITVITAAGMKKMRVRGMGGARVRGVRVARPFALLLICGGLFLLALSLVSCGGGAAEQSPGADAGQAGQTEKAGQAEQAPGSGAASADGAGSADGSGPLDGADGGLIVVGFSQVGAESDWRVANTKSMKAALSEANGFKLILTDAQQKQENQLAAIREFIAQKVDYIVLAPVTEQGWDETLKEAKAADIPVILVDRMIQTSDDSLYTCWVGSDFRKEGETAVAWIKEAFSGKDRLVIVHLQGSLGSSAQIGRTEGLDAGLGANAAWELAVRESADFTQVRGKEVMDRILKQFGRIDVVYCENDNMAFGAMDAMDEARRSYGVHGETAIVSFDATRKGLEATLAGKINYNIECNPLHGPRVAQIIRQLENGAVPGKLAYVDETAFDAATITQGEIDARDY